MKYDVEAYSDEGLVEVVMRYADYHLFDTLFVEKMGRILKRGRYLTPNQSQALRRIVRRFQMLKKMDEMGIK